MAFDLQEDSLIAKQFGTVVNVLSDEPANVTQLLLELGL